MSDGVRQLSRKTYIAMEVVLFVALHAGDKAVCSRDIAEAQGVTLRYLEQVLQLLVKHKVLKGTRGPKGGYSLFKEKRKTMLVEIYDAIDELERVESDMPPSLYGHVIFPVVMDVEAAMRDQLQGLSLLDLCEKAKAETDVKNDAQGNEFSI